MRLLLVPYTTLAANASARARLNWQRSYARSSTLAPCSHFCRRRHGQEVAQEANESEGRR
jgi:hypothetical protein